MQTKELKELFWVYRAVVDVDVRGYFVVGKRMEVNSVPPQPFERGGNEGIPPCRVDDDEVLLIQVVHLVDDNLNWRSGEALLGRPTNAIAQSAVQINENEFLSHLAPTSHTTG